MPRFLVVAPNWIGDALMAQPLLTLLRRKLGAVTIDVLAPQWVAPVLRHMPEVSDVISVPFRHGGLQLRDRWRTGRELRARAYDQAIVLPNSWKSALVPFFADIPLRSGYVGESRYGLLNLLYRRPGEPEPMTLHYARLAEKPGTEPPAPLPVPRLHVDPDAARDCARRFALGPPPARHAVLCPGAEYGPAKRWPAARFGELARDLNSRGLQVLLLGSSNDTGVCAEVARASGGTARDLCGRTSLDEAIAIIACADLVVSNDSGLMHVAAALNTPQVALFGSSSPTHTPPLSEQARVIWLGLDCSPCFERECPLGHFRCMNGIETARALGEIAHLGVLTSAAEPAHRD